MDDQTKAAIAKALKRLFSAFPITARDDAATSAETYMLALSEYSTDAIERSVEQFVTGRVEDHDGKFAPSVAQLSRNVRLWENALAVVNAKAPKLYTGILEVDFGNGRIDMRGKTAEEQEAIMQAKGLPQIAGDVRPSLPSMAYAVGDPDGSDQ